MSSLLTLSSSFLLSLFQPLQLWMTQISKWLFVLYYLHLLEPLDKDVPLAEDWYASNLHFISSILFAECIHLQNQLTSCSLSYDMQVLHEAIYDEVVNRLLKAYSSIKIGDPLKEGILMGKSFHKMISIVFQHRQTIRSCYVVIFYSILFYSLLFQDLFTLRMP